MSEKKSDSKRKEWEGHDYIRFTIADMQGIPKTRAIPARHMDKMVEERTTMCECK